MSHLFTSMKSNNSGSLFITLRQLMRAAVILPPPTLSVTIGSSGAPANEKGLCDNGIGGGRGGSVAMVAQLGIRSR